MDRLPSIYREAHVLPARRVRGGRGLLWLSLLTAGAWAGLALLLAVLMCVGRH